MSKRYRIFWSIGQYVDNENEEIIEANSQEEAEKAAYEACVQEMDSIAHWGAEECEEEKEL